MRLGLLESETERGSGFGDSLRRRFVDTITENRPEYAMKVQRVVQL